jgi:hypothetical protein
MRIAILLVLSACIVGGPDDADDPILIVHTQSPFYLPWEEGRAYWLEQGNGGLMSPQGIVPSPTPTGASCQPVGDHAIASMKYAYDFELPADTPVLASRAGTVTFVKGDVVPGNACYDGGGQECAGETNYVVIDHGDGTSTLYMHLNGVRVSRGDHVDRGDRIGRSGSTGWSNGPHLHIQRQSNCGTWFCSSVPMQFHEVGTPGCNAMPVSENFDWNAGHCWSKGLER